MIFFHSKTVYLKYIFLDVFFFFSTCGDLNDILTTIVHTTMLHILVGCIYKSEFIIHFNKILNSIKFQNFWIVYKTPWSKNIYNITRLARSLTPKEVAYVVVRLGHWRWGHEVQMRWLLVVEMVVDGVVWQHSSVLAPAALEELLHVRVFIFFITDRHVSHGWTAVVGRKPHVVVIVALTVKVASFRLLMRHELLVLLEAVAVASVILVAVPVPVPSDQLIKHFSLYILVFVFFDIDKWLRSFLVFLFIYNSCCVV